MRQLLFLLPLYFLPLVFGQDYILAIFIFSFILALQVVGLNVIFGYAGQLNLFQVAAFGLSGYVTFLTATKLGFGFWGGLGTSIAFITVVSIPIGFLCLRFGLRAFYFALITLAFSELARLIVNNWTDMTGGAMGLIVLDSIRLPLPGLGLVAIKGSLAWYYFSLTILLLGLVFFVILVKSWVGRCFEAIRVNEDLAETLGIGAFRYKLVAFIIANLFSAVSGALYTYYVGFIEPSYLGITLMLDALLILLLGGTGTVLGPVVGALVMGGLPHVIELPPVARTMMVGAVLILVILLMPEGIIGRLSRLFRKKRLSTESTRASLLSRFLGSRPNAA